MRILEQIGRFIDAIAKPEILVIGLYAMAFTVALAVVFFILKILLDGMRKRRRGR